MLRQRQLVLGLIFTVLTLSVTAEENPTTTATITLVDSTSSTFVTIGSNSKNTTTANTTIDHHEHTNNNNSVFNLNDTKPIVHAVNAQARKIEMTKLASSADVTASHKSTTTGGTGSFVISTTMIAIVAALILVVIVSVTVGTAMFVMRRRFSIWRLNNSKQNLNGDGGENSSANGADEKSADAASSSAATSPGGTVSDATAVVEQDNTKPTAARDTVDGSASATATTAVVVVTVENEIDETKTVGETPVVENVTNETEREAEKNEKSDQVQPQDLSSQSLIVNVLNELSESIANRLDDDQQPAVPKSPSTKSSKVAQEATTSVVTESTTETTTETTTVPLPEEPTTTSTE